MPIWVVGEGGEGEARPILPRGRPGGVRWASVSQTLDTVGPGWVTTVWEVGLCGHSGEDCLPGGPVRFFLALHPSP